VSEGFFFAPGDDYTSLDDFSENWEFFFSSVDKNTGIV
jgi:hypothetical protein